MDVLVEKFERQVSNYGGFEYIYKVRKVPGGIVIKSFHVPYSYDPEEILEFDDEVRKEIEKYLIKHDYKASQNY